MFLRLFGKNIQKMFILKFDFQQKSKKNGKKSNPKLFFHKIAPKVQIQNFFSEKTLLKRGFKNRHRARRPPAPPSPRGGSSRRRKGAPGAWSLQAQRGSAQGRPSGAHARRFPAPPEIVSRQFPNCEIVKGRELAQDKEMRMRGVV